ncbi:hypothetical protein [Corticibacter populi]|nr:hypothetical protein [Corticibacter populi]
MPPAPVIPRSYAQWRHCIVHECGLTLTAAYIAERLQALNQADSQETLRFRRLYGDAHWQAVCGWFAQARQEAG